MPEMPWFPMWAADFTNSRQVRTMSPEEVGVYVLLLCSEWMDGPIPKDEEMWPGLTNGADNAIALRVLMRSFCETDEGWVNERLERVRAEQNERTEQYSKAGRQAAKARWGKKKRDRNAIASRSECDDDAIQIQIQSNKKSTKRSRIPDGWEPTSKHARRAESSGIDLGREVERFKSHAAANDRRQVNWNAAFTTWLMNAEDFAGKNGKAPKPEKRRTLPREWERPAQ